MFGAARFPDFSEEMQRNSYNGFTRFVHNSLQEKTLNIHKLTILSTTLRYIFTTMEHFNWSWMDICNLVHNYTPVCSQVTREILKYSDSIDEETSLAFAQDFVRNDRLIRNLKRMPAKKAEMVLAIDGLNGTIGINGPVMDFKKYLENLGYSLCGTSNTFQNTPEWSWKQNHVLGVRKVYEKLEMLLPEEEQLAPFVYQVMRKVLQRVGGPYLPLQEEYQLSDNVTSECVDCYLNVANKSTVEKMIENLKIKWEKRLKRKGAKENVETIAQNEQGKDMEENVEREMFVKKIKK